MAKTLRQKLQDRMRREGASYPIHAMHRPKSAKPKQNGPDKGPEEQRVERENPRLAAKAREFCGANPKYIRETVFSTFSEVAAEAAAEEIQHVRAEAIGKSAKIDDDDREAAKLMQMPLSEYMKLRDQPEGALQEPNEEGEK